MTAVPNRSPLQVPGIFNMRDAGGFACDGGQVRLGRLIRSTEWTFLTPEGRTPLADLRLSAVIDLRTDRERAWRPDPSVPSVRRLAVDVVGGDRTVGRLAMALLETAAGEGSEAFDSDPLLSDARLAQEQLGDGRGRSKLLHAYRNFSDNPAARAGLADIMRMLADGERAAVHCAVGKDRTGWAIASVLLFLGVDWDDVVDDYLDSNRLLGEAVDLLLARVSDRGGDPDAIKTMLVVREEYLETFRTTMIESYGSIEGYVRDGLCLGPEVGARLREALVEPI